ncbi:hypothetical protein [Nonomuraea sp. SYSU D8015]|uniref:hypothetical protein n=1 Tax=Nonomuraea sp. SYSU D8015 TaxID=2593644 RepID=UPI001660C454|nr:hypothetical protein [Nonomuraea sp. SYSU D8015]
MSLLRVLTDVGVPVGRRMTCRIRNVQEDPLRPPLDPLTAVRPDTVWSVSVYGDIRDRRDDSVPDEELCERLRTYFPASLRGNRRVAVEMEIAELTPGGAFDFCLSNLRRACSELSIAMDFGAVAGSVDSEPGGRGAD